MLRGGLTIAVSLVKGPLPCRAYCPVNEAAGNVVYTIDGVLENLEASVRKQEHDFVSALTKYYHVDELKAGLVKLHT